MEGIIVELTRESSWPMFLVGVVIIVAVFVGPLLYLTLSKSILGRKFRVWRDTDTVVAHTHLYADVPVLHEHAGGGNAHEHDRITMARDDYVALIKKAHINE